MDIKTFPKVVPKESKFKFIGVVGTSLIKHRDRCVLGLKPVEYICMTYCDQYSNRKNEFVIHPADHIWKHIGLNEDVFISILIDLTRKGLLSINDDNYVITQKWRTLNPKEDDIFIEIWTLLGKKGNRATAKRNFQKCCIKNDPRKILERALLYNKYHDEIQTELKYRLKADNFLDPVTEKFKDNIGNEEKLRSTSKRGKL